MRAATVLLEQDPLDLARIADACGMLDAFRAAFRRYVGVIPSVYRSGFGQVA
ncbi:AraC family transcriptional regulator [Xanthomonas sp. 3075]|uniref:AraC family transcriptional regulator n=1 Tax=Xanthomonas sp. 3075 TaxID=3035315 RepID=UPI0016218619|nr:AraC family transcriptional regulator [Xanthomonas sp. 3075]MBB4131878.1 transcriptional regulator GlxA family with amidase domain [Xanthomonas sp. 3075]